MLEDQVSPKRCGHMSDKEVIPTDEWLAYVRGRVFWLVVSGAASSLLTIVTGRSP
jgi:isocitrate lyase